MALTLAVLQGKLRDVDHVKENIQEIVKALRLLPADERYEGEMVVAQCILNTVTEYDNLILQWHEYLINAKSHRAANVEQEDAKSDRIALTIRVNSIKAQRNRMREKLRPLQQKWGVDITNAILAAIPSTASVDYMLRMIKDASDICPDYFPLRRRANRLMAGRLIGTKGKRKRGYGEQRYVVPREWKAAAESFKLDEANATDKETIPDEWLQVLNLHIDKFGIFQEGYHSLTNDASHTGSTDSFNGDPQPGDPQPSAQP